LAKGIVDGSALSSAQWRHIEEQAFTGYDNDANMVKIAILNLYLHRLEKARIEFHNPLTTGKGGSYPGLTFDVILANPPFAGAIQKESILADINLPTRETELLFAKWFIDHLTKGGRAGVIVPAGVLFGGNKAAKKIRELLLTECALHAVVVMPSGVFKPYSGVSTAALIFEKGKKSESVWFYDITADGFSLDDKRTPIEANDIPDLLTKWPGREEGPNSFRVPVAKIGENDGSLEAGRYKPVVIEAANHDTPKAILAEVLTLEEEITAQAKKLLTEVKG
jgi:type I restriction enzyme M protein